MLKILVGINRHTDEVEAIVTTEARAVTEIEGHFDFEEVVTHFDVPDGRSTNHEKTFEVLHALDHLDPSSSPPFLALLRAVASAAFEEGRGKRRNRGRSPRIGDDCC